jgi:hypothetical protein
MIKIKSFQPLAVFSLFIILTTSFLLGCGANHEYIVGSDPEVMAIKQIISHQEAVDIIVNNVEYWYGYRSKPYSYVSNHWDSVNCHPPCFCEYSGNFKVTAIGVDFQTRGVTLGDHCVDNNINIKYKFDFTEVNKIFTYINEPLRGSSWGSGRGKIVIVLNNSANYYWDMRAVLKGDQKNLNGLKKTLAALETLCPNLIVNTPLK